VTTEHQGEGGTFEIDKSTGERKRVGIAFKPHHKEGDRARDGEGEPIAGVSREDHAALPAPAKQAPWDPQPAGAEPTASPAEPKASPEGKPGPASGKKGAPA
jgi:hypothetical protein